MARRQPIRERIRKLTDSERTVFIRGRLLLRNHKERDAISKFIVEDETRERGLKGLQEIYPEHFAGKSIAELLDFLIENWKVWLPRLAMVLVSLLLL